MIIQQRRSSIAGLALIVATLASLSGCGRNTKPAADAIPDVATLSSKVEVDCDFEGVADLVNEPTCYDVTVPEDWQKPDADDSVVLKVAVFKASPTDGDRAGSENGSTSGSDVASGAADPVIYLEGGPGGMAFETLPAVEASLVQPFIATRDVIIFDQRGVGQSTPNLKCDEESAVQVAYMKGELTDEEADTAMHEAVTACHDRLAAAGVNFTAYNSIASTNDIEAIRTTLGYDQVNLLGISYGTRLAQTYMRRYPDSVRAVILDSVYPVAAALDEDSQASVDGAFDAMFAACSADVDCAATYPHLKDDWEALRDELDENPVSIELTDPDGEPYTAELDGDALQQAGAVAFYSKPTFAMIPSAVAQAQEGDFAALTVLVQGSLDFGDSISWGMYYSVQCNEEVPFESADAIAAANNDTAESSDSSSGDTGVTDDGAWIVSLCDEWGAGTAPAVENEPVTSDIPTLVLAGSFDPVTPPAYGESVAKHLKNSYFFEFPTEGHGESMTQCGQQINAEFLDDPTKAPDATCVDEVTPPAWTPSEVNLTPFEITDPFTLSGMRPDGWLDQGAGYFVRVDSMVDPTAVYVQPLAGESTDSLLASIDIDFEPIDPIDVGGEQWETFDGEYEGNRARLLISPDHEFLVFLGATAEEIDQLTSTVAVPMAESLRIG